MNAAANSVRRGGTIYDQRVRARSPLPPVAARLARWASSGRGGRATLPRLARPRWLVIALRRTTAHRGLAPVAIGARIAVAIVQPAWAALPLTPARTGERLFLLI